MGPEWRMRRVTRIVGSHLLVDRCTIRAMRVRICRQEHEVDVATRAGGSTSMRADQSDGSYFQLRGRPCQKGSDDMLNAQTIAHVRFPISFN